MESKELAQRLWEGGEVERCHAIPHIGEYNIAQHSWRAVMLLYVLYPEASKNLIHALMFHDCHERYIGDTPATALWSDGEFAKRYTALGKKTDMALGVDFDLTHEEVMWLSALDKLELFLWTKDQVALGNYKASPMLGNLIHWFTRNEAPVAVREFVETHKITRMGDDIPS